MHMHTYIITYLILRLVLLLACTPGKRAISCWQLCLSRLVYVHFTHRFFGLRAVLLLKGYALCRRPLDTGGSCLPLCRKHEMNPKETRN